MREKIHYNRIVNGKEIRYNIVIPSMNLRFSPNYGLLKADMVAIVYNKRYCNVEVEDNIKAMLSSGKYCGKARTVQEWSDNEKFVYQILIHKIEVERAKQNSKGRRTKMGKK